jgi:hypothetical protein
MDANARPSPAVLALHVVNVVLVTIFLGLAEVRGSAPFLALGVLAAWLIYWRAIAALLELGWRQD